MGTGRVLDDVEDMKKVLKFFKLSAAANKLNLQKGVTMKDVKEKSGELQGFNYVLPAMIEGLEGSSNKRLIGETPETRAMVQQWLQYAITLRESCPVSSDLLKEIDGFLASSTFLVGHNLTVADPVMYLSLHPTYADLSFFEKEKYPHLSRWFRLLQQENELRKGKTITFSKASLYNSISAHP